MARLGRARRGLELHGLLIRDGDLASDHEKSLRMLLMNQHNDTAGKIEAQREHSRIAMAAPETLPKIVSPG